MNLEKLISQALRLEGIYLSIVTHSATEEEMKEAYRDYIEANDNVKR